LDSTLLVEGEREHFDNLGVKNFNPLAKPAAK
jgi:hypothetical protein